MVQFWCKRDRRAHRGAQIHAKMAVSGTSILESKLYKGLPFWHLDCHNGGFGLRPISAPGMSGLHAPMDPRGPVPDGAHGLNQAPPELRGTVSRDLVRPICEAGSSAPIRPGQGRWPLFRSGLGRDRPPVPNIRKMHRFESVSYSRDLLIFKNILFYSVLLKFLSIWVHLPSKTPEMRHPGSMNKLSVGVTL